LIFLVWLVIIMFLISKRMSRDFLSWSNDYLWTYSLKLQVFGFLFWRIINGNL
jgi:hypothetical protein